jgi:hypothetical protein
MVSDDLLIAELVVIKRQEPSFGVQKISAKLRETQPNWQFNSKRIRSLLREINKTWEDHPAPEPDLSQAPSLSIPLPACESDYQEDSPKQEELQDAELPISEPVAEIPVPVQIEDEVVKARPETDIVESFVQISDCSSPKVQDVMDNEDWVLIS